MGQEDAPWRGRNKERGPKEYEVGHVWDRIGPVYKEAKAALSVLPPEVALCNHQLLQQAPTPQVATEMLREVSVSCCPETKLWGLRKLCVELHTRQAGGS